MVKMNATARQYRTDSTLGHVRDSNIYVGVVKKYDESQKMGRLGVWIPEISGADQNNQQNWIIVRYASPFAGVTPISNLIEDSTDMAHSQQSYGLWMQPPDIGNQVLVCFVNGDIGKGYWFACIWQQNMNHMVPGIAVDVPTEPPETQKREGVSYPPVVEYNKWSKEDPNNPKRPVFKPLDEGLTNQGLYSDAERGPSSASARRDAISKVYGLLTPSGQQIYADDNPTNEYIRLRTKSGAQVLVNETTGFVYINSKNGNSWLEISDTGIDVYSAGSISLRSEGSVNIHADASLNIEAEGHLNFRSAGNITFQSQGQISVAGNSDLAIELGGGFSISAGDNIALGADGNLQFGASGDITSASGGNNIRSAATIFDNTTTVAPSPTGIDLEIQPPLNVPDIKGTSHGYTNTTKNTIVRRLPTHEPFAGHPSKGSSPVNQPSQDEFLSASDIRRGLSRSRNPAQDYTSAGTPIGIEALPKGNAKRAIANRGVVIAKILMQKYGLTDYQACGFVGNLWAESTLQAITEGTRSPTPPPASSIRIGYGLAQWTNPDRLSKFLNYCSAKGLNPQSDDANINFLIVELDSYKKQSIAGLKKNGPITISKGVWAGTFDTSNLAGCTIYVMAEFERPRPPGNAQQRIQYATWVLEAMGNSKGNVSSVSSSTTLSGNNTMVIGDEIGVGISGVLKSSSIATVGDTIQKALAKAKSQSPIKSTYVVISIGSNDIGISSSSASSLYSQYRDLVEEGGKVIWVLSRKNVTANTAIKQIASKNGDNTINLSDYPSNDGVHPQNYQNITNVIKALYP